MRLKDDKGRLTLQGFACGCIEQVEHAGIRTTLWREHGSAPWHVRQHDHNKNERIFWECYEHLSTARRRFARVEQEQINSNLGGSSHE